MQIIVLKACTKRHLLYLIWFYWMFYDHFSARSLTSLIWKGSSQMIKWEGYMQRHFNQLLTMFNFCTRELTYVLLHALICEKNTHWSWTKTPEKTNQKSSILSPNNNSVRFSTSCRPIPPPFTLKMYIYRFCYKRYHIITSHCMMYCLCYIYIVLTLT